MCLARSRNCPQHSGRRFPSPEYGINKVGENCARARRAVQISVFSHTEVSRVKTSSETCQTLGLVLELRTQPSLTFLSCPSHSSSKVSFDKFCFLLLPFSMAVIRRLVISPPLMNSSSPAASGQNQLRELFDSPYTGAVTTRTATLTGFRETSEHTVCLLYLYFPCVG